MLSHDLQQRATTMSKDQLNYIVHNVLPVVGVSLVARSKQHELDYASVVLGHCL